MIPSWEDVLEATLTEGFTSPGQQRQLPSYPFAEAGGKPSGSVVQAPGTPGETLRYNGDALQ